jgi:LAS superfamily LD-carboxypeptidase LdcB
MGSAAAISSDWNAALLTGRSSAHIVESTDPGFRLHRSAATALCRLQAAAAEAAIDLQPLSAFRDFGHQLRIWNEKYRGERPLLDHHGHPLKALTLSPAARIDAILLWSALPGASRHHWGTDVDVIDRACLAPGMRPALSRGEYASGGCFAPLNDWLGLHAAEFGFFRPYDLDRGGVQPEPWHLSFAPLSVPALAALTLEVLTEALQSAALDGREQLLPRLPELYTRYVRAVATAPAQALAVRAN